ncbi:MAG: glycosyltransferase family 2 protein [Alphaproteobacteria bacterium]
MPQEKLTRETALLSVCVSFRNEETVLDALIERLTEVLTGAGINYEILFANDASTDRSLEILTRHAAADPRVKVITLSRRFGVEPSMFAAMAYARGDAMVTIDADLQDPPELLPQMVDKWLGGADVVYTVRDQRLGEPWLKLFLTGIAYRIIDRLAVIHIPLDAGDFRLLSRRVVDILLTLSEPNTYLRGLVAWVGFRREPIHYVRQARHSGETHFKLVNKGPIATLFYGITGFSAVPVYLVTVAGLAVFIPSFLVLMGQLVAALFGVTPGAGAAVTFALTLWSSLMLAMGVVGLYVTRIFRTTLNRPRYVVDSLIGIDPAPSGVRASVRHPEMADT